MGTLLVILFLLAVCGLIAYTGDLLGRRMGKRRLTAFGLRPKHTAILFTIATGILIAGVSLAAAFGLSPGVRLAVTQGEALVLKNAALRRSIRALNRQFGDLTSSVDRLTSTNRGLESRNQALSVQQRRLQGDVRQLQMSNDRLRGENRRLGERTQRDRAELQRLALKNSGLSVQNSQLSLRQRTLSLSLASAQGQVSKAQGDLQILKDAIGTLRQTARKLATEEFIFAEGEEIARRIVPASAPEDVLRTQLETLLFEVRHLVAQKRNLVGDPRNPQKTATLAPYAARAADGRVQNLQHEADILRYLARSLALNHESIVLRAVAVENAIRESPVPITLQVYQNRIVLRKGEELATDRIYGRDSEGAVLEELVAFLQNEVRARALRNLGMIPGPLGEVGEVRFDPLLEVTRKIRQTGGWARIGAVARQDTWSAGPLHIDFYVVPEDRNDAAR